MAFAYKHRGFPGMFISSREKQTSPTSSSHSHFVMSSSMSDLGQLKTRAFLHLRQRNNSFAISLMIPYFLKWCSAMYPPTPLAAGGARQRRNYHQQGARSKKQEVRKQVQAARGKKQEARRKAVSKKKKKLKLEK